MRGRGCGDGRFRSQGMPAAALAKVGENLLVVIERGGGFGDQARAGKKTGRCGAPLLFSQLTGEAAHVDERVEGAGGAEGRVGV